MSVLPQPDGEGFDPVESAARMLREQRGATIVLGLILITIVAVLERVRVRRLEDLLDNAPVDDEPLDDEDLAALSEPIVASELIPAT